jgi:hypothetical protein
MVDYCSQAICNKEGYLKKNCILNRLQKGSPKEPAELIKGCKQEEL